MKKQIKQVYAQLCLYAIKSAGILLPFLVAACATTSPMPIENRASVEHGQLYVQKSSVTAATSRDARIGACAIPTGLKGANTGQGESKVWKDLVGRADTCVNEKNWTVVESLANEMAKADLDNPWPAYFLSLAAEARNDYSRAMWMTDLANKKSGGKVALFIYQRGRVWMKMGETQKSLVDLQRAVALEPRLLEGQLYLAELYSRDQDFGQAESYYRSALKIDDKNFAALTGLAEIDMSKDASTEAADLYARATAAEPKALYPWLRLAYIYEKIQKNPELTLGTLKAMKSKMDSGVLREKMDFDVNTRIRSLEEDIRARQPATAGSGKTADGTSHPGAKTKAGDKSGATSADAKTKKVSKDLSGEKVP